MARRWALALICTVALTTIGEAAELVADLETELSPVDPAPWLLGVCDGWLYFAAEDGRHGRELWRTDGTAAGTTLVDDLCPGRCDGLGRWAYPEFTGTDSLCLFGAEDGSAGVEPWTLDDRTPQRVLDLNPGPGGSDVREAARLPDGRLMLEVLPRPEYWFPGGSHGDLWITDGTASGTTWVDVPSPTECNAPYRQLTPASGGVAIRAHENVCWSDGTGAAISPIWTSSGTEPYEAPGPLIALGDALYFDGTDSAHGRELWRSDGTPASTELVRDFCPGTCHGHPWANVVGDRLYIGAIGDEANALPWAKDLWVSDGSSAGTTVLVGAGDGQPRNPGGAARIAGGPVVFWMESAGGEDYELWATDGTPETTRLITGGFWWLDRSVPIPGGRVFVAQRNGPVALWRTDGTPEGTAQIQTFDSFPSTLQLTSFDNRAAFVAPVESGQALWMTDGTEAGTRVLTEIAAPRASAEVRELVTVGQRLVFAATTVAEGPSLWALDEGAPVLLAGGIDPDGLVISGDLVFFLATTADHGQELWVSDGTAAGTRMVEDLAPGPDASGPTSLTPLNGGVVFAAGVPGDERFPWFSDGTVTTKLAQVDLNQGNHSDPLLGQCEPYPRQVVATGDQAFFAGLDAAGSVQLWVSDGTVGGTRVVTGIPTLACNPPVDEMVAVAGSVVFTVEAGQKLWRSDGTSTGTVELDSFGTAHDLTTVGDTLYLIEGDGTGFDRLWRVDGSSVSWVSDLAATSWSSHAANLTPVGDTLFLTVFSEEAGEELWVSNGTAEGTRMVRDLRPGPRGANPSGLREVDGVLVFAADDGEHGHELWRSDGSWLGTYQIADVASGPPPSTPAAFTLLGDTLFFAADDGATGRELWSLDRRELWRWRRCEGALCRPNTPSKAAQAHQEPVPNRARDDFAGPRSDR